MLWQDEREGTQVGYNNRPLNRTLTRSLTRSLARSLTAGVQHKCDLRVYVAITQDGRAYVYKDAALRTAINEFDPSDTSPKTMVTHPCVIRPTNEVLIRLLARLSPVRSDLA